MVRRRICAIAYGIGAEQHEVHAAELRRRQRRRALERIERVVARRRRTRPASNASGQIANATSRDVPRKRNRMPRWLELAALNASERATIHGRAAQERREQPRRGVGDQILDDPVHADRRCRDQASAQDGDRVAVKLEIGVGEPRVAVEEAALAHGRPRRPQAEGHERQEQVDDPDPEIVAGVAGERTLQVAGVPPALATSPELPRRDSRTARRGGQAPRRRLARARA